jgi:hypothetical protein
VDEVFEFLEIGFESDNSLNEFRKDRKDVRSSKEELVMGQFIQWDVRGIKNRLLRDFSRILLQMIRFGIFVSFFPCFKG